MSKHFLIKNEHGEVKSSFINTDFELIHIQHQFCTAQVSLYGGQVLTWQPKNQQPVFWLSNDAIYQQGKAIRGGVPLCWPWFGAYTPPDSSQDPQETINTNTQNNIQNHGFARVSRWQLSDCQLNKQGVELTLTLTGSNIQNCWPYAFTLTQKLFFGEHFKQQLIITNHSEQAIAYNGALHSYFCVSSPENISIPSLNNTAFDDKLTGEHSIQANDVFCVGPIDRIYHSRNRMNIIDKKWQRTIVIENENTEQWVLWNPGKAGAEAMADIHQNGEQEYVCLEAANTKWQTIAAHSFTTMGQTIYLDNLSNSAKP